MYRPHGFSATQVPSICSLIFLWFLRKVTSCQSDSLCPMRSFRSIYDKKLKKKNKNPVAVSSWCVETPWLGGWIIFDSKKNNSSPKNDDVCRCGKNQPRYTYSIDIITEADMSHISYIPFGHYIRGMTSCGSNWMISLFLSGSFESSPSAQGIFTFLTQHGSSIPNIAVPL